MLVVWGVLILGPHVTAAGPYSVDLAELTLCAWSGGVPHSPGYPLWTILAELSLTVQPNTDPFHAIGRMGVLMACLASVLTRQCMRMLGSGVWASTAAASLLFVVPLNIRAFSIPEVHALDLLLLSGAMTAIVRGQQNEHHGWTGLGMVMAILAIGHRPINLILVLVVALGFRFEREQKRSMAAGLLAGIGAQTLLYWDLWSRIQNDTTQWVDEHALRTLEGFGRFVVGLPFEKFFLWTPSVPHHVIRPLELGLQVTALILAALAAPWSIRHKRLGWMMAVMAGWHLFFISIYRVGDREFFIFPTLWVGVLSVGLSFQHINRTLRVHTEKLFLVLVLALSVVNLRGLIKTGHGPWQTELETVLNSVPENSILLTDDWKARTGLIAMREIYGVGETVDVVRISLEGGDIHRLVEWFDNLVPLLLLEERTEISELRPVRVHDGRLIPQLIEGGLITSPAEAGTWAVQATTPD